MIKPVGFYVLIEDVEIEEVTSGGIIVPQETVEREQTGMDFGTILAFGPLCFVGYTKAGGEYCDGPEDWGVKIGDKVEFRRYEGKSNTSDGRNLRYVPDSAIIGVEEE